MPPLPFDMTAIWDPRHFENPPPPIKIGALPISTNPMSGVPYPSWDNQAYLATNILDCAIKAPGTPYYTLSIKPCDTLFKDIFKYCHNLSINLTDYYAYLTIHQGLAIKGSTFRRGGLHVDGFQGARVHPKVRGDFSFIIISAFPTYFYHQSWKVSHLDIATDNFFSHFEQQVNTNPIQFSPGDIILCSPYTVHASPPITQSVPRTFIRLTYSVRQFNRYGNTINYRLPTRFVYEARDVSSSLRNAPPITEGGDLGGSLLHKSTP